MSRVSRTLFVYLNLAFGASVGAAVSLLMLQEDAWTDRPSGALLTAGAMVVFGTAYVVTATARGQRVTLRGMLWAATGATAVVIGSTLALSAPGWVLVWVAAAVAGVVTGLVRPLPDRRG